MKKLHLLLISLFVICAYQLNAMQKELIAGKDMSWQEFHFELYCRDYIFLKPDKKAVLEYISNPDNVLNKHRDYTILFIDENAPEPWLKESKIKVDEFRQSCLRKACMNGDKEIVQCLLQRKDVDVNERNDSGITALQYACANSRYDTELIEWLLAHGADVNNVSCDGGTALMDACRHRKYEAATLLLKQPTIDPHIDFYPGKTKTPLFFVAYWDNTLLNVFLDSGKIALDTKDVYKISWFYTAWYYKTLRKWNFCRYQNNRDINSLHIFERANEAQKKMFLNNELHALCQMHARLGKKSDVKAFIQFCIDSGADVEARNDQGNRPVDSAYGMYSALKKLVSGQNGELILKEIVLHALLVHTPKHTWYENESYEIERLVATAVDENKKSYDYCWDERRKQEFRRQLLEKQNHK